MAAVAVLPQEALAGPAEESRSDLQPPPVGERDVVEGLEHEVAVAQAQRNFHFEASGRPHVSLDAKKRRRAQTEIGKNRRTGELLRNLLPRVLDDGKPVAPRSIQAENKQEMIPVAGIGLIEIRHLDRKSTRLNSSHQIISYAVFCLKKKKQ